MSDAEVQRVVIPYLERAWQKTVRLSLDRFSVVLAHRGAGKGIFAINHIIREACQCQRDGADFIYVLPQRIQAARNVWKEFKKYAGVVPGVAFNNSSMTISFPHNNSRIMILGAEDPDTLRGLHVNGCVLDEVSDMHPDTWTAIEPMTKNWDAWVLFIGTPKGHDAFHSMYQRSQDPAFKAFGWTGSKFTVHDTNLFSERQILEAQMNSKSPEIYRQEYLCDFEAAVTGAYYAALIEEARSADRLPFCGVKLPGKPTTTLFRPDLPVHTAWDLGIQDAMVVWFFQRVSVVDPVTHAVTLHLHVIDFEQQTGLGFPEWKQILEGRTGKLGYKYGTHYAPHDIKVRELGAGVSRLETAAKLGIRFTQVAKHDVVDGIECVREHLGVCSFDMVKCRDGVEALSNYRSKTDRLGNDLGPRHDLHSHASDAFRYLIMGVFRVQRRSARMVNQSWMAA